jgi:hypothetical protein
VVDTFSVQRTSTDNEGLYVTVSGADANAIVETFYQEDSGALYGFRKRYDGNVGIGTASPTELLTINKAATTGKWSSFLVGGAEKGRINWDNTNSIFEFSTPGVRMDFNTNGGQLFFHASNLFFNASTSITRAGDATSTATQRDSLRLNFQSSLWNGSAAQLTYASIRQIASTTTNLGNRLGFFLNGTSAAADTGATEYMSILSNGNVGIGTASPNAKLQVDGLIAIRNNGGLSYQGEISTNGGEIRIGQSVFKLKNSIPILWSSTTDGNGTKDLGLRRNSAGVLEVYDGITATGLDANRRDLLARNITAYYE